jgi:hypothetical protein
MGEVQQPGRQAVATACGVFYLTFERLYVILTHDKATFSVNYAFFAIIAKPRLVLAVKIVELLYSYHLSLPCYLPTDVCRVLGMHSRSASRKVRRMGLRGSLRWPKE